MKSKIQQKLYGKINISDNLMIDSSIISPKMQYGSSTPDSSMKANNDIKENFIKKMNKIFSSPDKTKKKIQGANPYQNFKIDIFVSNSIPPVNQIQTMNYYKDKAAKESLVSNFQKSTKDFLSEKGSSHNFKLNNSHLDSLSNNIKLANTNVYGAIEKEHQKKSHQALGKNI